MLELLINHSGYNCTNLIPEIILAQDRDWWRALVDMVMNLQVLLNVGK
jgi:hypothetical protein